MSPEQGTGDRDLDARSDVYSLAAVLYEMLAGEPPHTGVTSQAVIAKLLTERPTSLRVARDTVPQHVDAAVMKALAKVPVDRFATAGGFADATRHEGPVEIEEAPKGIRVRGVIAAAVVAALVGVGAWWMQTASDRTQPLDPNVIAVLPFTVRGSEDVAYLGEGMVDLLSMTLGGGGAQRTVDPKTLLSFVSSQVDALLDPQSGRAVAQHFGAGRYLLGTIVESGGQLRMQGTLFDAAREQEVITQATVDGAVGDVFSLVNRLTAEILATQHPGPSGHLARVASMTTDSLEALKAFLEGEEAWRAPRDSARARSAFQRTAEIDSTFALAWSRLAHVVGRWWITDPTFDYLDRALRHGDRLSERERLRLQGINAYYRGQAEDAEQAFRAIVREYPDDAAAWNDLGSVHYMYDWRRGRPHEEAREYFERSQFLDPGNADNYWQLHLISIFEGKLEEAEQHLRRYTSDASVPPELRAPRVLAGNDSIAKKQITDELRTASDFQIWWASNMVSYTDNPTGARRLARLLIEPTRSLQVRGVGHLMLAHYAAAGGQWTTAEEELAAAEPLYRAPTIVFKPMLAAAPFWQVPDEDLEAIREQLGVWDGSGAAPGHELDRQFVFAEGMYPLLRMYLLGLVSARLREDARAGEYAAELEGLKGPEHAASLPQDLARSVRAQVAINQERPKDALALLEQARMETLPGQFIFSYGTSFFMQNHERFLRAELLHELGRDEEALGWYGAFPFLGYSSAIYRGPSHLRRGEIYEQAGDHEKALKHYMLFVEWWKDADPELQPQVEDVRRRIARLAGETGNNE
jgi:tetratricopeptide (TPR) repeat protein